MVNALSTPTRSACCSNLSGAAFVLFVAFAGALGGALGGCASSRGPYATAAESDRNPLEAQRLNMLGAAILDEVGAIEPIPTGGPGHAEQQVEFRERLARAESLLREAITADLYCGPAHNNLGIVYLSQTPPKLYEAASEFEWARKLIPGHPDPRVNLALTLERAGKLDDALAAVRSALESRPGHLPAMQTLAKLQVKHNRTDERTREHLGEIALRGAPEWRVWARLRLAKASLGAAP